MTTWNKKVSQSALPYLYYKSASYFFADIALRSIITASSSSLIHIRLPLRVDIHEDGQSEFWKCHFPQLQTLQVRCLTGHTILTWTPSVKTFLQNHQSTLLQLRIEVPDNNSQRVDAEPDFLDCTGYHFAVSFTLPKAGTLQKPLMLRKLDCDIFIFSYIFQRYRSILEELEELTLYSGIVYDHNNDALLPANPLRTMSDVIFGRLTNVMESPPFPLLRHLGFKIDHNPEPVLSLLHKAGKSKSQALESEYEVVEAWEGFLKSTLFQLTRVFGPSIKSLSGIIPINSTNHVIIDAELLVSAFRGFSELAYIEFLHDFPMPEFLMNEENRLVYVKELAEGIRRLELVKAHPLRDSSSNERMDVLYHITRIDSGVRVDREVKAVDYLAVDRPGYVKEDDNALGQFSYFDKFG